MNCATFAKDKMRQHSFDCDRLAAENSSYLILHNAVNPVCNPPQPPQAYCY